MTRDKLIFLTVKDKQVTCDNAMYSFLFYYLDINCMRV